MGAIFVQNWTFLKNRKQTYPLIPIWFWKGNKSQNLSSFNPHKYLLAEAFAAFHVTFDFGFGEYRRGSVRVLNTNKFNLVIGVTGFAKVTSEPV